MKFQIGPVERTEAVFLDHEFARLGRDLGIDLNSRLTFAQGNPRRYRFVELEETHIASVARMDMGGVDDRYAAAPAEGDRLPKSRDDRPSRRGLEQRSDSHKIVLHVHHDQRGVPRIDGVNGVVRQLLAPSQRVPSVTLLPQLNYPRDACRRTGPLRDRF